MSCGDPHETDCREVLALVYGFLDGELDDDGRDRIRQHLDECSPCLRQYGLERMVKAMVARSCGCEHAPEELRTRVVTRIREITVTYRSTYRTEVPEPGP